MKKKLKLITINCLVYFLLTTICFTFFYTGSLFAEQINLTLSGEAIQSSTDTWYGITGSASRAIDGNTNGDWRNGSVTHTYKENQPWWRVDLTNTCEISSIILWNRTDSCSDRLTNFNVSIFDESMQTVYSENFYESGGTFLPNLEITIPKNTNGKYVRVQLNGSNYLSLAEVQVFGPGSEPAYLSAADFDKDGDVDGSDLAIFAADFGRTDCEAEILGTWIGDEDNGQLDSWGFVLSCNGLEVVGPQEWYRGTFLLNKAANPYQIDFLITASHDGGNTGKISLGIYQVEGNTLTIAFNEPGVTTRPLSFTLNGTRVFLLSK